MSKQHLTPKDLESASWDTTSNFSEPQIKYLILSTQRSGSNFLCRNLAKLGLGVPLEYFNPGHKSALNARYGTTGNDNAYIQALFKFRSPNRVFGAKVQAHHLKRHEELFSTHFSPRDTRAILLMRADIRSAAVSLHNARRTGRWWNTDDIATKPRPDIAEGDPKHIEECAQRILDHEIYLRGVLSGSPLKNICIFFENMDEDFTGVISRILNFMDRSYMMDVSKLETFSRLPKA